jgi:hypothetical protein
MQQQHTSAQQQRHMIIMVISQLPWKRDSRSCRNAAASETGQHDDDASDMGNMMMMSRSCRQSCSSKVEQHTSTQQAHMIMTAVHVHDDSAAALG